MAEKERSPADIAKVRKHHKQAYRFLSSALEEEEKDDSNVKKAMMFYENGVHELNQGISVKLDGEGDDYERAQKLQDKMKGNLEHAKSRIDELAALTQESSDKTEKENTTPTIDLTNSKPKNDVPPIKPTSSSKPLKPKPIASKSSQPKTSFSNVPTSTKKPATPSIKSSSKTVSSTRKTGPRQPSAEAEKKVSNLKNVDSKHVNLILNEVVEKGRGVTFGDVGGMENAKQTLHEIVILPSLRPEEKGTSQNVDVKNQLFTGLRAPARGLLFFGPPGNGKTLLAKAVATEANAVFFNISAASLTSKWVGEGEKLVRALFAVARELQPAIIFIDEIDSLLSERKDGEHESSRRLKTEFLVGFDGVVSETDERILVMGATNRPWELDDAALRRLVKRIQIPLPDVQTRIDILKTVLTKQPHLKLSDRDYYEIAKRTETYSGSDLAALCREAALMPIRNMSADEIKSVPADKVRAVNVSDFIEALNTIRPSVSSEYLTKFDDWNQKFGTLKT